jgi:hypothetical protein
MSFQLSSHGYRSCCRLTRTSRWRRHRPCSLDVDILADAVSSELEFHFGSDPVSEAAGSLVAGAKVVVPLAVDGIVT